MTDDFQEIDGVGSSREEDLNEAGYETYSELGDADAEELADEINRLSEDKALELVVQAQNLADLEAAETEADSDSPSASENDDAPEIGESDSEQILVEDEVGDSDDDEAASDDAEDDSEDTDEQPDVVSFELTFGNPMQYDTFFYTVYEARNNYIRTNRREQTDALENILESLREVGPDGEVTVELEPQEVHDLHNEVRGQIVDYQGENLMDQHDELQQVLNRIDEVRQAELF